MILVMIKFLEYLLLLIKKQMRVLKILLLMVSFMNLV